MATTTNLERRDNPSMNLEKTAEGTHSGPYYEPAVDIFENDDALTILADMPGVGDKGIEIDLREGVLTLLGKAEPTSQQGETIYQEFSHGNYLRRFTLTDQIDQDKISAQLQNGMLRVELPKAARVKPRKIQVLAS